MRPSRRPWPRTLLEQTPFRPTQVETRLSAVFGAVEYAMGRPFHHGRDQTNNTVVFPTVSRLSCKHNTFPKGTRVEKIYCLQGETLHTFIPRGLFRCVVAAHLREVDLVKKIGQVLDTGLSLSPHGKTENEPTCVTRTFGSYLMRESNGNARRKRHAKSGRPSTRRRCSNVSARSISAATRRAQVERFSLMFRFPTSRGCDL